MAPSILISGCFTGLIALLLGVYVTFALRQKGPILSNSYLWLSPTQKRNANKKAEYKFVSIVFGGLCGVFVFLTIYIFTKASWAGALLWISLGLVVCYALYDAVKIATKGHH